MTAAWAEVLDDMATAAPAETSIGGQAVRDAISRRRRWRAGGVAGVVLATVGGFSLWGAAQPADPPAVDEPRAVALASVELDPETDRSISPFAVAPACGAPAPTVATSAAGLSLVPLRDADLVHAPARAEYGGVIRARVEAGPAAPAGTPVAAMMGALYVHEGRIVGYSWFHTSPSYGSLGGGTLEPWANVDAEAAYCVGGTVDALGGLPVGRYDVYPVVRVHGSPEVAAHRSLLTQGMGSPTVPLTVEYPTEYYTRDLDVTLTGNPISFTVYESLDPTRAALAESRTRLPWPEQPACGAWYTERPDPSATPVYISVPRLAPRDLGSGTELAVEVSVRASQLPAQVALSGPLDLWVTGPALNGHATARSVVGHGTLTFPDEPYEWLQEGSPSVTVRAIVADFAWCDSRPQYLPLKAAVTGALGLGDTGGIARVTTADVR